MYFVVGGTLLATIVGLTAQHGVQAFVSYSSITVIARNTKPSSRWDAKHVRNGFRDPHGYDGRLAAIRCRRCRGSSVRTSPPLMAEAQQSPLGGERWRTSRPQFISILSGDGIEQKLPFASASGFPLSVVEDGEDGRKRVVAVPDESEEGWVDPRSYGELWIPEDSPLPTMTLCLGMLTKNGQPRYVMPFVDLVVDKGGCRWRNRGLNSIPFAHCWEDVARAATGSLSLSAYAEEKVEGSETDSIWGPLVENVGVTEAFTDLVGVVADPPGELDLGNGFQLLVAQVHGGDPLSLPKCNGRVRVFLTDLQEPAQFLEVEDLRGVSEVDFDVVAVASGGNSEFLPEVYKGLFV